MDRCGATCWVAVICAGETSDPAAEAAQTEWRISLNTTAMIGRRLVIAA